jgi:hypothetical protein
MKKTSRKLILHLLFFLPQPRHIAVDRWLRGRKEFHTLTRADCVVVSHGKSGRTWLRVMLSRFYQLKHELPQLQLLEFDNLHRKSPQIPTIFFTHDNLLKDYTKSGDTKAEFYDRRVLLLIRNPADVAVSQFFQWKHRMSLRKIELNKLPARGEDISIFEFVVKVLPTIIEFLNNWAKETPRLKNILVVRYEDMRLRPEVAMKRILEFIGTPGSDDQIRDAVAFASYENMRKLEEEEGFRSKRLVPGDRGNPDSYKVRRAKVGGYRDYFNDRELTVIDDLVRSGLSPHYIDMEERAQRLLMDPV